LQRSGRQAKLNYFIVVKGNFFDITRQQHLLKLLLVSFDRRTSAEIEHSKQQEQ